MSRFRHELKHYITVPDCIALRGCLSLIAFPDPFAGPDGSYSVRSLYFDNFYDKALREKLDGVDKREKFRLRYYNGECESVKLEKKSKIGGLCSKDTVTITRMECQKILDGDIDWMKTDSRPLINEFYAKLRFEQLKPRTIVDYRREAFVFPAGNVRVTIDSDIKSGLYSTAFFDPLAATVRTPSPIILEVKYDEFIPEIVAHVVGIAGAGATAFSKYAACRAI